MFFLIALHRETPLSSRVKRIAPAVESQNGRIEQRLHGLFMKNRTKVLIVEDELQLAFLMTNVLTRIGCDVETVCTGKKAMELASEIKFDLITLDIGLPDVSGFEVCTKLKERHISRNTPVIFISARPCETDIQEGMKRGAADYITKPFEVTDFVYRIILHAKVKTNQTIDFQMEEAAA